MMNITVTYNTQCPSAHMLDIAEMGLRGGGGKSDKKVGVISSTQWHFSICTFDFDMIRWHLESSTPIPGSYLRRNQFVKSMFCLNRKVYMYIYMIFLSAGVYYPADRACHRRLCSHSTD